MDSLEAFSGEYSEKLVVLAQKKRIPISGTFELLPTCNMRCRMCYIQHTPQREELQPVEFWVDLFEQAIAEGMLFPLLTGGEPLIYPEFETLYERLIKMPVYLVMNTNGTLLDQEKIKWMAKHPPRRLNISLYGASDETYGELCGNPNGFSQVMRAFELLKVHDIQFRVHGTIVPENVKDYSRMVEICDKLEVPLGVTHYMFPPYRKDGCDAYQNRLSPKEYAQQTFIHLRNQFRSKTKEAYMINVGQRCLAMEKPEIFSLYGNNRVACKAGICTFWVDWRGNMSGCGIHNQGTFNLHEMGFKDAWKNVIAYTDSIRLSEKCATCKYRCICNTCAAAAFCETGAFDGTPEYLCQYCEAYGKLLMEERRNLFGNP